MATKSAFRTVTTPRFRAAFAHIFSPQQPMENSADKTPKYGVTMLFDPAGQKTKEYAAMRDLAIHALREKFGDKVVPDGDWFKLQIPTSAKDGKGNTIFQTKSIRNPFRDGNEKAQLEGFAGNTFAAATSKMQPGLVDENLQRILSEQDFFSGCYARATVSAYAYDTAGNIGVSFGLQNVQRLGKGEAMAGRTAAENDFDAVDGSFDNAGGDDQSFMN
jgi:hypothetical protein